MLIFPSLGSTSDEVRMIEYNGKPYRTIYNVERFNGIYKGKKDGYLQLNPDGSGVYVYDIFGVAPASCTKGPISFRYGFLIDDNDSIVRMQRDYGYSYPILLESTGENAFQGCRTRVLLDFLMEYNDGSIGVSSSDDWTRQD
ncbi:MAG: hypothetical protein P8X57_00740 [Cyclobacteriaceae bacterium]